MRRGDLCEDIIKRNSETVYKLAYSLVRSRSDADDIYQEVFIRYVKKHPVFHSAEHEKAWFLRVTINCCKNFWKSSWRRRTVELTETPEYSGMEQEDFTLTETVKQLPEKYRIVIHLFYYEEMSIEEIGKITGRKASTVRGQLTRARKMLKEKLGGL